MYKTLTTEFMRTNKYVANVRQGPLVNYNKKVLAKDDQNEYFKFGFRLCLYRYMLYISVYSINEPENILHIHNRCNMIIGNI